MKLYTQVRVRRLTEPPDSKRYDGWGTNRRAPAIGDVGTLVDIFSAPGEPDRYVVECGGASGDHSWLGEFLEEEIESLEAKPSKG